MKNAIMNLFGLSKVNSNPEPTEVKNDLNAFIKDFLNGLDNPIIMSMMHRMLDTNSFTKFGIEVYSFTDEEKQKLELMKPHLDELVRSVAKIKNIETKQNTVSDWDSVSNKIG